MKRRFQITLLHNSYEVSSGVIDLNQKIFERVNETWRKKYGHDLVDDSKVAAYIASRILFKNSTLSQISGWTDLPDQYARMIEWPKVFPKSKVRAVEMKPRTSQAESAALPAVAW